MTSNPTEINTVQENAEEALALTNQFLAEAGVKDKDGNPAQLKQLAGSPMWLMFLARGQQATEWQERANVVYNATNIQECEDEQVENLALLSGVAKRTRTSTFVTVQITNNQDEAIVVNSRNSKFTDSVYSYEWYIGQNITLASGESAKVQLYCATTNDLSLNAGVTFTCTPLFDNSFDTFTCQNLSASVYGTKDETTAELRNRVMTGTSAYSAVNKAQDAIAQLSGISKCSIYFNPSAINVLTLTGGISVAPRTALIVIRGADANDLLAKTYYEYMDVQSYNPGSSYDVLTSYVRIGALDMPVHFMQATTKKVYARVTVKLNASDLNYAGYVKGVLTSYNGTTEVGQQLTTKLLSVWLNDIADYVSIETVELSDDGETWGSSTNIPCYNIADIDLENISYVTV